MKNKGLVLIKRPDHTFPETIDIFEVKEVPLPTLEEGEILVRVIYIGIDPVMRVWLSGAKTYIDSVQIGQVMPAFGVGECVDTRSNRFRKGDLAFGVLACANFTKTKGSAINKMPEMLKINDPFLPLSLSIFGVTGLTALGSMQQIPEENRPKPENPKTMCISSAAGSTGSTATQLAKLWGYRTIAIVSSEAKFDFVRKLGADECVAYKAAKKGDDIDTRKLSSLIRKVAPQGVDVYFDCAGEEVLDSVLPVMNKNGYIILCGATSTYNAWKNRGGLLNLSTMIQNNVKAEGVLFVNERKKMYNAFGEMYQLVQEGTIKHQEEFLLGVDKFVHGLKRVFTGQNLGKIIVQLDESVPLPKF